MNKSLAIWKASFLQLRIYLLCVLAVVGAGFIANFIVFLSVGSEDSTQVSPMNQLVICLIFVGSVLPAGFFKRILNVGATRKEYYVGLLTIYAIWAAAAAIANLLWWKLEVGIIRDYTGTFNIIEIFHWDQFGVLGVLVYQFGTYMLLMSLLSLLFSGLRHVAGWILWVVLIAAIPIGTSVPTLQPKVADFFQTLLFNDSLWKGFGLELVLILAFLAGGWLFTRKRSFY
ncbi:hypothetical protein [Cohnella sp. REN36]|uniref:hypothetical protein n=1 Tax=Cohnella sp. REN36 TaxID=2887347 RepID=UPI001D13953A|nr:hypothetical protein [Cohnella sp. REN36]MCC3372248.1 hypothetical protein [Cohnella sp. REN36]